MKAKNIFWGIFFIAAAALIIINQMGLYTNFNFFKAAGGVILLAIAIEGCFNRCFGAILFPLALIGVIFSEELSIQSLTPWPILLVALLGTIGLTLVFPRRHKPHKKSCCFDNSKTYESFDDSYTKCNYTVNEDPMSDDKNNNNNSSNNSSSNTYNDDSASFVTCSVRFGSIIKYVNSTNFQRADISAHFGGAKVFFDNAVIVPGTQAVINIDASFSGIELFIPRSWKLINNADTSLGAVEEKNHFNSDSPITVHLTGHSNFCGIEITYI